MSFFLLHHLLKKLPPGGIPAPFRGIAIKLKTATLHAQSHFYSIPSKYPFRILLLNLHNRLIFAAAFTDSISLEPMVKRLEFIFLNNIGLNLFQVRAYKLNGSVAFCAHYVVMSRMMIAVLEPR